MANFKITATTTVAELKEQFHNEFGGILRIYQGRSEAPEDATLVSLGGKVGELECRASRTVGKFIEAFQSELGLKVKVYTKDNWVSVLDGITLATVREIPKNARKAQMEQYLAYQRDEKEEVILFNPADYHFNEFGLAKVEVNGKYGFIDKDGKLVVEPNLDQVYFFSEDGLAQACIDDKWGLIDKDGKFVIEPKFDSIDHFNDGLARARVNGKWGFIDKDGKFAIEPKFDSVRKFDDGLAEACVNDKWGFIDKDGKFVIEPKFDSVDSFDENSLSKVLIDDKYGCIDKSGNYVVEPAFDYINCFNDGRAIVEQSGKAGVIDTTGKFVVELIFDGLEPLEYGLARAKIDGKYGFINEDGTFEIEPEFDWLPDYFGNEEDGPTCAGIYVDDEMKFGFIDRSGNFVIDPIYDDNAEFWDGTANVCLDGEDITIDRNGNQVEG